LIIVRLINLLFVTFHPTSQVDALVKYLANVVTERRYCM